MAATQNGRELERAISKLIETEVRLRLQALVEANKTLEMYQFLGYLKSAIDAFDKRQVEKQERSIRVEHHQGEHSG